MPAKRGSSDCQLSSAQSHLVEAARPDRDRHVRSGRPARDRQFHRPDEVGPGSEGQVEPKCFVEFGTKWSVEGADQRSDALDIDRSNLLRLSFRVAWQPG